MSVSFSALNDGQLVTVHLHDVTGLDALVYRRDTAEDLDVRLGALLGAAPEQPSDWLLADRALIVWLWTRHNVDPDAVLAAVAAEVKMMPAPAPAAGDVDAPVAESD